MLTIVRDRQYIAFTLAPDLSTIHPVVHWFKELAPEWGIDNSGRVAVALRELLFKAVAQEDRQGRSRELCCRIERTAEGPFRITVEEERDWFDFNRLNITVSDASKNAYRRAHIGIRRIFGSADGNARGNRMSVLVDGTGTGEESRSTATGSVTALGRGTADTGGRNRREGDEIHAADG